MTALLALNARTFSSLKRHPNYRFYFIGQAVSQTGTWIDKIAQAWLIYSLTKSAFAVGLLAACQFIPFTVFGLVAGVVVDRLDAWRTVVVTQMIRMAIAVALAVIVLTGVVDAWMVYTLAVTTGVVLVLDAPSRQALTFQMVGRRELPNAVALNSSLFNAARIVGPGVGGLLIAAFGVGPSFAINAVSFIAVLAGLLRMDPRKFVALDRPDERPTVLRGIREGLGYARRTPSVRLVLAMLVAISTVALNFNVLLPLLARKTLHAGPDVFGLLGASFGAGALFGGLVSAALGRASSRVTVAAAAGLGLAELILAPQHSLLPAAVLLFATGACFTVYTANANTTLQLGAPDHMRGRVIGLYYFAFNGLAPLGGVLTGVLAAKGGTLLAFGVAGATTIFVALAAMPQVVRLRRSAPQAA